MTTVNGRQVRNRVCARVLPVNGAGEVLLLHGWDPAVPDAPYWFSIGGATDPGESLVDAAAWWTPDALDADGSAANERLTEIMRDAIRTIRGTP